jgi:integrase/recombinase XerC
VRGKGSKERVVPISDSLAESIRLGAAGHTPGAPTDGWLFPNTTGGHLTAYHVGQLVAHLLPGEWTMHTCATNVARAPTGAPEAYALCRCYQNTQA